MCHCELSKPVLCSVLAQVVLTGLRWQRQGGVQLHLCLSKRNTAEPLFFANSSDF